MPRYDYDAVVVGSGPNGLAAAVRLAEYGCQVLVLEAKDEIGGGARSAALTEPGFVHDVCSSVYPMAAGSPFFRSLPLSPYGLEWVHPNIPMAHPLGDGSAGLLHRSLDETVATLGEDGERYRQLIAPLVSEWQALSRELMQPMQHVPRHPLSMARFGMRALWPTDRLARHLFRGAPARALLTGVAAHSNVPLTRPGPTAFGLILAMMGHGVGWPFAKGGAGRISDALADYLRRLGGTVETGHRVDRIEAVPPARAVLLDVTPRQFLCMARRHLPMDYVQRLETYRYGAAVFKVDYALSDPIPWLADPCRKAGTVHVGGTYDRVVASENVVGNGRVPEEPFIILTQPTLFDPERAPVDKHTAWAYCHVPNGSCVDMTGRIEAHIERYAPGFRDCIIERHVRSPADLERDNANLVGGDINGGSNHLTQLLARPVLQVVPYRTPLPGYYLCSSSTPPGGGVHGMCGYHAAQAAIGDVFH